MKHLSIVLAALFILSFSAIAAEAKMPRPGCQTKMLVQRCEKGKKPGPKPIQAPPSARTGR